MNERIKECWLKAAREDSDDKWDTQEEFIERFARLIVRECEQVSLKNSHRDDDMGAIIAKNIQKHFGVEL